MSQPVDVTVTFTPWAGRPWSSIGQANETTVRIVGPGHDLRTLLRTIQRRTRLRVTTKVSAPHSYEVAITGLGTNGTVLTCESVAWTPTGGHVVQSQDFPLAGIASIEVMPDGHRWPVEDRPPG